MLSIKTVCLNRMVLLGEAHLRRAVTEFVQHYHHERNHQGLDNALIVLTSALCVLATLIGWVFDRRRDFAIMKALGASERLVSSFFAAEAAAMGVIGAILGFLIGIGVAAWIGRANFHAPVVPRFSVFPYVLAGSIAVALISAVLPLGLLRRVEPAIILRGE